MKKLSCLLLLSVLISCNRDQINDNTEDSFNSKKTITSESSQKKNNGLKESEVIKHTDEGASIIHATLHRGKRWTKKENERRAGQGRPPIASCTGGFGICNVTILSGDNQVYPYPGHEFIFDPTERNIKITFQNEIKDVQNGSVFISSDDDYFSLPIEVSKDVYGKNETRYITITPDDYITKIDSENPFGVVTVNYELTKEQY